MITPEIILLLCGIHSLVFAVFHAFFWKLFDWKNEVPKLNRANRAILRISNELLILLFLFAAVGCFTISGELLYSKAGNFLLVGFSIFWLIRTFQQFVYLRYRHWLVYLLTFLFMLGAVLWALPLIMLG